MRKDNQEKNRIIQAVENAVSKYTPHEIITRYDRHKKTITAETTLDHPDRPIKIKIIAGYNTWLIIQDNFLKNKFVSFEEIEPFIFRLPKADREALRAKWNNDMAWQVYHATEKTNYINPKAKPGPSKKHTGQKHSTADIRYYSRHVYVFLKYWLKRPVLEWPPVLTFFFKQNNINVRIYERDIDRVEKLTKKIVQIYRNTCIGDPDDTDYFFRRYIYCRTGLLRLRRSYDKNGYLPNRKPLNEIFPPPKT